MCLSVCLSVSLSLPPSLSLSVYLVRGVRTHLLISSKFHFQDLFSCSISLLQWRISNQSGMITWYANNTYVIKERWYWTMKSVPRATKPIIPCRKLNFWQAAAYVGQWLWFLRYVHLETNMMKCEGFKVRWKLSLSCLSLLGYQWLYTCQVSSWLHGAWVLISRGTW